MTADVSLRIVVVAPPAGVDFGVQLGKGAGYTTVQTQRSDGADLRFEIVVSVKDDRPDGAPNFLGPLTHGPAAGRFVYLDIGALAGQADSGWQRRIKLPLAGITWSLIHQVTADPKLVLEARLPGTGKDGGPSCATVHPVGGWQCRKRRS